MQHKYCKNIDIIDPETINPWVTECIHRHAKRYDFRGLLFRYGLDKIAYRAFLSTGDYFILEGTIKAICEDMCWQIRNRKLNLRPVKIEQRKDGTSGKVRWIGNESPMQQAFDFVAVYASMEIFEKRLSPFQMSSIKGRGQVKGMKQIQKWIAADNRAERYAQKHNLHYTKKCKYRVKCDVKQCYPSASAEIFISLLSKDTKNETLLWLWETLLKSHRVNVVADTGETLKYSGFMIGSWASQWAMQYLLSFAYWFIMSQHNKRGRKIASHAMLYLDDILVLGGNRRQMKSLTLKIVDFILLKTGLQIKGNWHIDRTADCGVDMMGYVVWGSAKTTLRGRNFIKMRRMALRIEQRGYNVSIRQARRITSQKGLVKHSDNQSMWLKYKLGHLYRAAQDTVSIYERRSKC